MATINQRNTYIRNLNNPELDNHKKRVYEYIKPKGNITYNSVIDYFYDNMGIRTSSTGGAFSNLMDMGLIKEVSEGIFCYVEDETEQQELFIKRQKEKRLKWEKKGYEEGWFDLWKFENGYMKDGK